MCVCVERGWKVVCVCTCMERGKGVVCVCEAKGRTLTAVVVVSGDRKGHLHDPVIVVGLSSLCPGRTGREEGMEEGGEREG